ncbi:MAG: penicillin-binding protein 2 [Bacillota bacterium]
MDKRLKVFRIIVLIFFGILLLRAGQLQVIEGGYYKQLSEGNRISNRPINAPRGKIYANPEETEELKDVLLATNKLSYSIYVLPNEIPEDKDVEKLLARLTEICELDLDTGNNTSREQLKENYQENKKRIREEKGSWYSSFPILIKKNISAENMVLIKENQDQLPGITVEEFPAREYVYDDLVAHNLGYVGEINSREFNKYRQDEKDYKVGDYVGKTGLELEYENELRGYGGVEQVEVNNKGEEIKVLGARPPEPGNNLILHLDLKIQKKISEIVEEQVEQLRQNDDQDNDGPTGAAVVVMEPDTGFVRALSSYPEFDLNKFSKGISSSEYQKLSNDSQQPFLNRITSAHSAGSVFKLVTGIAAIEELGIDGDTEFEDKNGQFRIPGWSRPFRNWNPVGEGVLDFTRAIARSNNVVFYELGYELYNNGNKEKLSEYAHEFGFGQPTGIDLPSEESGLVPDKDWKQSNNGEGWYPGDAVNLAIGQGGLLVTPLQLLNMVSAVANKGEIYRPQIVDKIVDSGGDVVRNIEPELIKKMDVNAESFSIIKEGMVDTTAENYGTAEGFFDELPFKVAGKTGTAQTVDGSSNHGWFVGFAPAENPEIAFVVFLERGSSSRNTLPIARKLLEVYFGIGEGVPELPLTETYLNQKNSVYQKLFSFFEVVFPLE